MFSLKLRGMIALIDVKQLMTRAGILNGIRESFFIIKTFKVKESEGSEACCGHDLRDMFFAHPFHPGVAGVWRNFNGDIVDEC